MQAMLTAPDTRVTEQVIVSAPMPIAEAQKVEWEIRHGPYKGTRGLMGQLLAEKKMDLGDLGYLLSHWSDPKVKGAALTLLAHQLGQLQTVETTLRFGPQVFNGSTYLEDQQWDSEMQAVAFATIGLVTGLNVAVLMLWNAVQQIVRGSFWLVTLIALMLVLPSVLIPLALFFWWQIRKRTDNARAFRMGREGEEWVAEKLRTMLDNRWTVFHNLVLKGQRGDNDFVLVGPPGVWVLEVKAYGTEVRVRDGVWERRKGKGWGKLGSDPVGQARSNAGNLHRVMDCEGIKLWVNAVVVLTQAQPATNFGPTAESVWKYFEVDDKLSELNRLPGCLTETDRQRIVASLKAGLAKIPPP